MKKIFRFLLVFNVLAFGSLLHADDIVDVSQYGMIDLVPEADQSAAIAINDNNQVVGVFSMNNSNSIFLWENNVPVQILDITIYNGDLFVENDENNEGFEGLDLSLEFSNYFINNNKQISGTYYADDDLSFSNERSFIWDEVAGFVDIGTLGGTSTYINLFNDNMQAAGYSGVPFEDTNLPPLELTDTDQEILIDGVQHVFFYDAGKMIDLENLFREDVGGAWENVFLADLNNLGEVVLIATIGADKPEMFCKSYVWNQSTFQLLLPDEADDTSICVAHLDEQHNMIVASIANGETQFFFIDGSTGERTPIMDRSLNSIQDFEFTKWVVRNNLPLRLDTTASTINQGIDGINYITNGESIRRLLIESQPFYDLTNEFYTHIKGQNSQGNIVGYAQTTFQKPHAFFASPQN